MTALEISDSSPRDVQALLYGRSGNPLSVTVFGVAAAVWVDVLGNDLYALSVYPPEGGEIEPEPVSTTAALLDLARRLCRQYAPAAFDSWQLAEAKRLGLQLGLAL